MKKYLIPILFMSIIYWNCEEEAEPKDCAGFEGGNNICGCTDSTAINYDSTATFDDGSCEYDITPPTVSIQSPITSQTVNGIVTIIIQTNDNEGINRVEFYIDDSLYFTDTELPYQYDWNTIEYEDFSEHIIKVISYDNSDNFTESQPILLTLDNRVYLWGEYYSIEYTTELNLSYSGLTGSIPPEIGNLTNLTYLDFSWNNLSGSIPSEIGNLINLTHLDLYGIGLTGEIPLEIWNLTNLTHLDLAGGYLIDYPNNLIGSIPREIGNLTNLTYLDFSWNNLSGSIPSEIGNLINLTSLRFTGNALSGEIPEEICNLVQVEYWISSYPDIDTQLIYSNFSQNQLCPPYPSCIEDYVGEQDTSNCD